MEKYFSINDVSIMTGLTTRTLRNYLKNRVLKGIKVNGAWKFTEKDLSDFILNPSVKSSIKAKNNAIVYDFIIDEKKKTNQICSIIDLYEAECKPQEISQWLCKYINSSKEGNIKFSFEKYGKNTRIILRGEEVFVMGILNEYYKRNV